jgi:hypothetical protein
VPDLHGGLIEKLCTLSLHTNIQKFFTPELQLEDPSQKKKSCKKDKYMFALASFGWKWYFTG